MSEKRSSQHAAKNLAQVGVLKQEYVLCQQTLEKLESKLDFEKKKLTSVQASLRDAQEALSQAQEAIDADYLPEGAQPKARIQKRDLAQMVFIIIVYVFTYIYIII